MCIIKTPKIAPTDPTAKTPDPAVIRNPYLDGLDPKAKSLRTGRSSLRIERGGGRGTPPPPVHDTTPRAGPGGVSAVQPSASPVQGGVLGGLGLKILRRAQ